MGLIPVRKKSSEDSSGIALFMVISAMSVLSILVTEFTYIAQINQRIAFDGLDSLKAHYLAKSALKLSLLRLKAYTQVKGVIGSLTGGNTSVVPKQVLDAVWSYPFFYPIPTNVPGMDMDSKAMIEKFQKNSGLDGQFSAVIESESSKYNLNLILAPFAPTGPTATSGVTGPSATTGPSGPTAQTASTAPTGPPQFNPDQARQSLSDYLTQILQNKFIEDSDFQDEYRDFRMDDFMDYLVGWADPTYQQRNSGGFTAMPPKHAPFYSITELHMIPGMDDKLYDLFTPGLTASTTPGINVNTVGETVLRAIVPLITPDEVKEFFQYRVSTQQDNSFKSADDFFNYLSSYVGAYKGNQEAISQLKTNLQNRNIRIVTDESDFKITVQAQVNQATRLIEAWVTLGSQSGTSGPSGPTPQPTPVPTQNAPPGSGLAAPVPDPGLRITYMRIN